MGYAGYMLSFGSSPQLAHDLFRLATCQSRPQAELVASYIKTP